MKENTGQSRMLPTQSGKRMSQGLSGVRKAARERREERFTSLLHHLTIDLLRDSFYALQRGASPGVDGMRWEEYESGLEDRLTDLHTRVHRGSYRAQPSRRVYIPKATSAGHRGAGGQDRPTGRGDDPQPDIRGRLQGLLLRVPSGAQSSSGARCAGCGTGAEEGELGARRRHTWLFRQHESRVDSEVHRAPGGPTAGYFA